MLIRPLLTRQPQPQSGLVGGSATFGVTVTNTATLPITYRWRRGGSFLTNGVIMISSLTNSTLTMTNLQMTDNNVLISVVVTNDAGNILSSTAALMVLADFDRDGLPDDWENLQPGFNLADPSDGVADHDGDLMSTSDEYFAGTDYLDPVSFLKVEIANNGTALLWFNAVSNRTYGVQYTEGLPPVWQRLADVYSQPVTRLEFVTDPTAATDRHYRIVTPIQP